MPKVSASEAEGPAFESRWARLFFNNLENLMVGKSAEKVSNKTKKELDHY